MDPAHIESNRRHETYTINCDGEMKRAMKKAQIKYSKSQRRNNWFLLKKTGVSSFLELEVRRVWIEKNGG